MAILSPAGQSPEALLRRHLPELGVTPTDALVATLLQFLGLLQKWNQAFNLTSIREPGEMVTRHVLDSLSARPWLQGERVLDVGCGAGLPGIPLALVEPGRHFTLLDAGLKKIRFVRQAIGTLGIRNAAAVQSRIEDYAAVQPFDTILCRAFASLPDFIAGAGRLLAPGGRCLALKGRRPDDELAALPAGWVAESVTPVTVPGLTGERHMVILRPSGAAGSGS